MRKALSETGVEISSFIVVYRWSGPTEEQRQFAVANWKRMIQIAGDMGVKVINTELSGDPNQQEICNGMWFRSMEELLPIIEREDTFNQTLDCRYIANPPWLNSRGKADVTIHQHLAMGEGDVDFDGIFETLREIDFAGRQLCPNPPKAGGDNIACVSMFGFPEKMDTQAPQARERIEQELLKG